MKRLTILLLSVFLSLAARAQSTAKLAEKGDVKACLELARQAVGDYRFEEASKWLDKAEVTLKKKKLKEPAIDSLRNEAAWKERFLRGTDQVTVIDSIVLDKTEFLQAYKLSEETGSLDSYAHFFTSVEDGWLFKTELGDRIYFGKRVEDGSKRICVSDLLADGSWSEPVELQGLRLEGSNEDFPFITSDGQTLYFASENRPDGMGGYDIYVTREGDNNAYLKPENLGMPYNSPANDYMMVMDEMNGLGWFASDRYQPAGRVCIYVFLPNESRRSFDFDSTALDDILGTALLRSIKDTQKDAEVVAKGRQHLQEARAFRPKTQVEKEFELVIDDNRIYTQYSQFKNSQAAKLCQQWVEQKKQLADLERKLEGDRTSYSNGQHDLASAIRQEESQLEKLRAEVHKLEKQVRNLEHQS